MSAPDPNATLPPADPLLTGSLHAAPPEPADAPAELPPGYEPLGELGRGGMGVVYKARHVQLNRVVALKMVLHAGHTRPSDVARFLAEAEAVAALSHPHVVQIYETGRHGLLPYFTLEYCPGGTLADRLRDGPLPAKAAAELAAKLAAAVEAAHARGIVHRDLKPANVLLTADGTPKVADFGLAKKLDTEDGITATGAVLGTPPYMAPEQAAGDGRAVGPRTDVYALGAILYHLLTGRPPFLGATPMETLIQVQVDDPVPPSRLAPSTPRDLETVCLACLHKSPARRYASAAALADDLTRFVRGEPVLARPAGPLERAAKWAKRRPLAATTVAFAAVIVLGAAVSGVWIAQLRQNLIRDNEAWMAYTAKENEKLITNRKALQAEQAETLRLTAMARVHLADRDWQANQADMARRHLEAVPPEARHWEWHYLERATRGGHLTLLGHLGAVRSAAFSPDGSRVVTASDDATARIWDAVTGAQLSVLTGHAGPVAAAAFSPDGRSLVTAGEDTVARIWDANTGREILCLRGHNAGVKVAAFNPDGRRIVTASHDETVRIWDARTGAEILCLPGNIEPFAVYSPGGRQLVTIDGFRARIRDANTGALSATLPDPWGTGFTATFSPDGTTLFASDWQLVRLWDARSGAEIPARKRNQFGRSVEAAAYSPDGSRVVTASGDATARVFDARSGDEDCSLRGHTANVTGVVFSPDGQRIVTASEDWTARVWNARTPRWSGRARGEDVSPNQWTGAWAAATSRGFVVATGEGELAADRWGVAPGVTPVRLRGRVAGLTAAAFADGGQLVTAHPDGTARVWDARTGLETATLRGHDGPVVATAISPDGRRAVTVGADKMGQLWDAVTGAKLHALPNVDTKHVGAVAFSPDGGLVVTAYAGGTAQVWDARTGEGLAILRGASAEILAAAFAPDGLQLVTAGDDAVARIWDARTGAERVALRGHSSIVTAAAFSPDGRRVVTGSDDESVRIWDAAGGEELLVLRELGLNAHSVAFSADGRDVFGTSMLGCRTWTARTGTPLVALRNAGRDGPVTYSRDGRRAYVGESTWDTATGRRLDEPKPAETFGRDNASPDGQWFATRSGPDVFLWGLRPTAEEVALRDAMARFSYDWADDRGLTAVIENRWFAAAFHYGQILDRFAGGVGELTLAARAEIELGRRERAAAFLVRAANEYAWNLADAADLGIIAAEDWHRMAVVFHLAGCDDLARFCVAQLHGRFAGPAPAAAAAAAAALAIGRADPLAALATQGALAARAAERRWLVRAAALVPDAVPPPDMDDPLLRGMALARRDGDAAVTLLAPLDAPLAVAFQAVAELTRGKPDAARAALDSPRLAAEKLHALDATDRLAVECVRREVAARLAK